MTKEEIRRAIWGTSTSEYAWIAIFAIGKGLTFLLAMACMVKYLWG